VTFEVELTDGKKGPVFRPIDKVLKDITNYLQDHNNLKPHYSVISIKKVIQAYRKADLLTSDQVQILEKAELNRQAASSIVQTNRQTSKPDQSLPMENFNLKENKNDLLKDLFSEQSRSKVLSALAPHFRFILQNPSLTDAQIKDKQNSLNSNLQQKADLNKLREAFRLAVYKNETASLRNWLTTNLGQQVVSSLEAVLFETASHIHGQIQHQLKKGKGADQNVIDSQVETYIRTTNTLAAISKKNAEGNK
ncbi:MAG: hypothetical protein LW817_02615, partial [Candidatus Caenarcaniphilales bacterium]|jgi:hypothetical protein|nr:hypothetical protein [Candidatus Caenarcaniphilales bacterium]